MMSNGLVVEQNFVCKSEIRRINLCKYHLIDRLNSSNTQHSIVLFISSAFNQDSNNFNSKNISLPKFPEKIKVEYFDISTIEKEFSDFINELHLIKTPNFVIKHFTSLIESILQILDFNVVQY